MSPFQDKKILEDILSRLPVKCLLRLRCVSKSWLALISSPHFVKLHLNRSAEAKINRSLFLKCRRIYRVDFDSFEDGVDRPALVNYHPLINFHPGFEMWGSCDGLMCISYAKDTVFLWNPSTRKSLKLTHAPVEFPNLSTFRHEVHYGIGCICNDYKVVRIVDVLNSRGDFLDYEIKVYSLNSNSWHRIEISPRFRKLSRNAYTVVGGALYWISGVHPDFDGKGRIVALDIETEKYRVIPLPWHYDPYFLTSLNNFEGWLGVSRQSYRKTANICLLNGYCVGKQLIAKLPRISTDTLLVPIAYSKSGKKVLLEMDCKKLFWYNLEHKSLEKIVLRGMEEGLIGLESDILFYGLEGLICLESLVSLDGTTVVADAKNPREDEMNPQSNSEY